MFLWDELLATNLVRISKGKMMGDFNKNKMVGLTWLIIPKSLSKSQIINHQISNKFKFPKFNLSV
jgi:hypothetical protein